MYLMNAILVWIRIGHGWIDFIQENILMIAENVKYNTSIAQCCTSVRKGIAQSHVLLNL